MAARVMKMPKTEIMKTPMQNNVVIVLMTSMVVIMVVSVIVICWRRAGAAPRSRARRGSTCYSAWDEKVFEGVKQHYCCLKQQRAPIVATLPPRPVEAIEKGQNTVAIVLMLALFLP